MRGCRTAPQYRRESNRPAQALSVSIGLTFGEESSCRVNNGRRRCLYKPYPHRPPGAGAGVCEGVCAFSVAGSDIDLTYAETCHSCSSGILPPPGGHPVGPAFHQGLMSLTPSRFKRERERFLLGLRSL